jgi:hypothetical protein
VSNVPDSSENLSGSPNKLHFHWNTPELSSLEVLKAQCSLAVPLYRTLEYNEVSGLIGTNLLRIELCFGNYQQLIIETNSPEHWYICPVTKHGIAILTILDHGLHVVEIVSSGPDSGRRDEDVRIVD